jgi:hypothetical protein
MVIDEFYVEAQPVAATIDSYQYVCIGCLFIAAYFFYKRESLKE